MEMRKMAIRQRKKVIQQIAVDLGYDSKGKRKKINKTFHRGKKEAKAFEAKLKHQIKNNNIIDNKKSFEE